MMPIPAAPFPARSMLPIFSDANFDRTNSDWSDFDTTTVGKSEPDFSNLIPDTGFGSSPDAQP
jgi:hypothetical protein